jgi:hypothetical protein
MKKCIFCNQPVTQQQLDGAKAVTAGRNKYAHLACISHHRAGDPVPFTTDPATMITPPVTNPCLPTGRPRPWPLADALHPDDRYAVRINPTVVIPSYPKLA